VNVDAILLAVFARGQRRARSAFDLGAGVGAVGLSLLHLDAAEHVTMIEIDEAAAALALENARANRWAERVEVVNADVESAARKRVGAADLVVCNPPYVEPGRGRAPSAGRGQARTGPLRTFLDAARRLAGRRARVCFVYPANESTTLLTELRARGLEPKRLRAVYGKPSSPARIVLVECSAAKPGGLVMEPPLVETDARGARSSELDAILRLRT
jgi:tRNA1Val (adenine37-N6)-methyltransferase